ncbi:MAG: cell division protein FtsQ [bacterium]|jgi:cell division protein FtsQ
MKINWGIIKFLVITSLIVFMFGFSKQRNEVRKITKIDIEFKDENRLFITENTVNKLLIQNKDSVTTISKETLDLNKMEKRLLENPMIKNADVYVTVDGVLGAKVLQRNPIARIEGNPSFYLDEDGKNMPLSKVHSARVPIITGISVNQYAEVTELVKKITNDEFMKEYIVGLDVTTEGDVFLRIRKNEFKVLFGKSIDMENKFQKFKAFYKLTKKDSLLDNYSLINLKFKDQVVATKRESNGG